MIPHDFTGIYDPAGKFISRENNTFRIILRCAEQAKNEGLISLEDEIDMMDNPVLKLAIKLLVDGVGHDVLIHEMQTIIARIIAELEMVLSCVRFILRNIEDAGFSEGFDRYMESNAIVFRHDLHYAMKEELAAIWETARMPEGVSGRYEKIIRNAFWNTDKSSAWLMIEDELRTIAEENGTYYQAVREGVTGIFCGDTPWKISKTIRAIAGCPHDEADNSEVVDCLGMLIPPQFDFAGQFCGGVAIVGFGNDPGFVRKDGKTFRMPECDELINYGNGILSYRREDRWGFLNKEGEMLTRAEYEEIGWNFHGDTIWVKKDGQKGSVDRLGCFMHLSQSSVDDARSDAGTSKHDKADIEPLFENGKVGFVDSNGKVIIKPRFDKVGWWIEGYAVVIENGKFGCVRSDGAIILEPDFEDIFGIDFGYCWIGKGGKIGLVDLEAAGEIIIEPRFDKAYRFSDGVACVMENGKWGVCDRDGDYIFKPEFDWIDSFFHNGLARVMKDGLCGVITTGGRYCIQLQFNMLYRFNDTVAHVENNGKHGLVNITTGEVVVDIIYDWLWDFSEGTALAKKDGRWGYIDKDGHPLTAFRFDDGDDVSEGIAAVSVNGKWGYIEVLPHA